MERSSKTSATQKLILLFVMLILWFFWAGNTSNVDYLNYSEIYNHMSALNLTGWGGVEYGFNFLMRTFISFGLNYQQFLMVLSFISLMLMSIAFYRLSNYPGYLAICYAFFPYFLDVMQIRNALASAIIANAIVFLIKKKYFKFIILLLLSAAFHTTMLFYSVFLITFLNEKLVARISIFTATVGCFFGIPFLQLIMKYIPSGSKYIVYLEGNTLSVKMLYIIFFAAFVFLCNFLFIKYRIINSKTYRKDAQPSTVKVGAQREFFEFMTKFGYIMLMLVPFLFIDSDFFRLFRNVFFLFNNAMIVLWSSNILLKRHLLIEFSLFMFPVLVGINYLYWYQWSNLVLEVLLNNMFFY